MGYYMGYHNKASVPDIRFPINTPQRQAVFAALRLQGKNVEDAEAGVLEAEVKNTIEKTGMAYGWDFDVKKRVVKIEAVTEQHYGQYGRGDRHTVIPASWFRQHKRTGEFDWKGIEKVCTERVAYSRRKEDEERNKQNKTKKADLLIEAIELRHGKMGLGAPHGTVILHLPIGNMAEADLIIGALKKAGAILK